MIKEKYYEGLSGWLIIVGLVIVISPMRVVGMIFPVYFDIFSNGSWEALTTPGTEAYSPFWAPLLIVEMLTNGGVVLAWIYIAFLFFLKKKSFQKWYIGIFIFTLISIPIDALAIKLVLPSEPIFDAENTREFLRTAISALIWIPYTLVSKRVKATFVR